MYCPDCRVEFRREFMVCADCGVALVPGDPPPTVHDNVDAAASMEELLVTADPLHAELVAATLLEQGIEPVVRTRFVGGLTLTSTETHWAPGQDRVILVPGVAHARAREVLESIGPPVPSHSEDGLEAAADTRERRQRARTKLLAGLIVAPVLASIAYGAFILFGTLLDSIAEPTRPTEARPPVISPPPAIRRLRHACAIGNRTACVNLGADYEMGEGVSKNPARAASLYRLGCDGGVAIGCINLGLLYEKGIGMAADPRKAASLYQLGCEAGAMPGCYCLGLAYQRGLGVAPDPDRAARLFREACDGQYLHSCVSLAYYYRTGAGVRQSASEAVRLYRLACDGGITQGCYNLGVSYDTGMGVGHDHSEAMRLYEQACSGGYQQACEQTRRR